MKKNLLHLLIGLGTCGLTSAQSFQTGPSTTHSPYLRSSIPGSTVTSILTVTETVQGYMLCGLGDGLGAYDNGGSTFTLLMNHEMSTTQGAVRAHGQIGAFVSKWVINKSNLSVVSGADLIQDVYVWNGTSYTMYNSANTSTLTRFGRFCAADLPEVSAFYNSQNGKGTQEKIFMNGEENGTEGRAFAHISTGTTAGSTYELPHLGKFSWENSVASPYESDKTIVAGLDDATPGQVYMYIGAKTTTGTVIEKAGLFGGKLYGVAVLGMVNEQSTSTPSAGTAFNLIDLGQVHNMSGATLNTNSNNTGVTNFLRPEDGAWDPNRPSDFYFVTTNSFTSPSRMWRLRFTDINNPELGGTITAVLDGSEGQKMMDNLVMDNNGHIMIQEDPGGQNHLAKVWQYNIMNDAMTLAMDHDSTRFKTGGANFLTIDEESSGIIDMQGILGAGWFILYDQAHYAVPSPAVDGGQLLAFFNPATAAANSEINLIGNAVSIPDNNITTSTTNNTNFGMVNVNTVLTKTFAIQNTNSGTLIVSAISLSGVNASDFTVTAPSVPFVLAGITSQTISVQFKSNTAGVKVATINVMSSDFDEKKYDFKIEAEAASPEIDLLGNGIIIVGPNTSPTPADNTDFGNVIANTAKTHTFEIKNTGTGTLNISGISLSGANFTQYSFSITSAPAFPVSLGANASQSFAVQFAPVFPNVTHIATVTVNSNDTDEASYSYVITGMSSMNVGIDEVNSEFGTAMYPNPANDAVSINLTLQSNEAVLFTVFDVQGKKVMSVQENAKQDGLNTFKINTSSLKNGEYFVQMRTDNKVKTFKMVVSH